MHHTSRRFVCPGVNQQQIAKPYKTLRSPRGSVVVCGDRIVTDEMATAKAAVLATWLDRNIISEQQLEKFEWTPYDQP